MKRRLFTILSALSLLLFAAVVVLWVRSFAVAHTVGHRSERAVVAFLSGQGQVALVVSRKTTAAHSSEWPSGGLFVESQPVTYPGGLTENRAGFGASTGVLIRGNGWTADRDYLVLPHWLLAVILALAPAMTLAGRARRRLRTRIGLCPSCGYDLRATPGRCPECGLVPAAPPPPPPPA